MLIFLEFLLNYMKYFSLWVIIIKLPLLSSFYSFLFLFLLFYFPIFFRSFSSFFQPSFPPSSIPFFSLFVDIPNYSLYLSKYLIFLYSNVLEHFEYYPRSKEQNFCASDKVFGVLWHICILTCLLAHRQ